MPREVIDLIRRMSLTNPRWGAPRIHGELLKVGFELSEATVAKYMMRHRRPPSQTWRTFLANHAKDLVSSDFFVVPTVFFRVLFVFVILSHDRRRPVHVAVTDHPPSVRAQLIGSWRLVSRQSRRANGEVEADAGLSATPLGILIYDQSGHVAAQLSRRDRTLAILPGECQAAITTKGTPDTAQTILGYDAYFGTYEVNENEGTVIHHLEAALFPGDVGKDIERDFTISGDQLTITFNATTREGVKVTRTLIWQQMK